MSVHTAVNRAAVIALANEILSRDATTRTAAASAALSACFDLHASDGIWGGSEAALAMGYAGHSPNYDLLGLITADVAALLDSRQG